MKGSRSGELPKLAVFKFTSCDGCQLTLLDCEDELLALAERVRIARFLEATRAELGGPYDLAIIEGSITTAADAARIERIRARSKTLVSIGACATAGGIQALRNFADAGELVSSIYASPETIETLATSTAIAEHVPVDYQLWGCPPDKGQLLEVIDAFLSGRRPQIEDCSVCVECKRAGHVCVLVAHGTPCLGPVTHAGCGALCPGFDRGCYGCFGPKETPNTPSLDARLVQLGRSRRELVRDYRGVNAHAAAFEEASLGHAKKNDRGP